MSAPPPLPPPPGGGAPSRQTPSIPTTGSGYTSGKSAGARSAAAAFGDSDSEDESEAAVAARKRDKDERTKRRKQAAFASVQAATNPFGGPMPGAGMWDRTGPTPTPPSSAPPPGPPAGPPPSGPPPSGYPPHPPPGHTGRPPVPSGPPPSGPPPPPSGPPPSGPPPGRPGPTADYSKSTDFAAAVALAKAKAAAIKAKMAMGLSPNAGPPAQPPAAPSYASASSYAPPQQQPPQKQYSYTTASEMITAADIEQKLNPKIKYAYDSDEDTEGGTWEHKKRAAEMKKTAQRAKELTEMAHRKHHMADYLPKEELEKLYEKHQALKDGKSGELEDYRKSKIKADNVGYQMLQKEGWSKGSGLGPTEQGITVPINKGSASLGTGVGATKPEELVKEDDAFDLYRKRMMLSYKFRPNPLNNPRRPY